MLYFGAVPFIHTARPLPESTSWFQTVSGKLGFRATYNHKPGPEGGTLGGRALDLDLWPAWGMLTDPKDVHSKQMNEFGDDPTCAFPEQFSHLSPSTPSPHPTRILRSVPKYDHFHAHPI